MGIGSTAGPLLLPATGTADGVDEAALDVGGVATETTSISVMARSAPSDRPPAEDKASTGAAGGGELPKLNVS